MIRKPAIPTILFLSLMNTAHSAPVPEVSITVANKVFHQMQSGVGASWHSILHPPVSHGGSAFGGNPPVIPRHEKLWQSIEQQAEWLGLKFIRAEMDWRQWQPKPGHFTWDSPEMKILDRILTWADRHDTDVMLQCMWLNVEWLAFPEYCGDPALTHASAPADLDAYANSWVTLLQELITKRGHTCIRWINLVNEPNFYWWLIPPDTGARQDRGKQAAYLAEAMNKVRTAITAANLPVKLMGPDFTDLPVFENISNEPWFAVVDDVDFHSYCSCFDWEDPKQQPASWAYRMGERLEQTLVKYRAETTAAGKGLYLTEFGTQTYGYAADDPAPGSFKASLKDTELLIRALNLGIDGCNHWSFTNRGDADGQWQFIDTWDRQWKNWLAEAVPHAGSYQVLGIATRHLPQRAKVLETTVIGGRADDCQRVWAAAARSPKDGNLTLLIVNDAVRPWDTRLTVKGAGGEFHRMTSTADASLEQVLDYHPVSFVADVADLILPPFSLTILTDQPIAMDAPGRW